MNCKTCQTELPDLVLNPGTAPSSALQAHLDSCTSCAQELNSLRSTFALLDTWKAPEPSPFFDQKLAVLLREEQAAPRAGWIENLRSYLLFNTGRQFRPAMTGALALMLLLGGGTFARFSGFPAPLPVQTSATVTDLQILDKNEQTLQQMDQLLQDDDSDDPPAVPPQS